ncbi:MAG: DUF1080 domain-containing protein [Planctomycetota bacterium]|jgi:hypothetical protein|nr:DUF1080 domain-containing protein [Planctomycetota bacterium]
MRIPLMFLFVCISAVGGYCQDGPGLVPIFDGKTLNGWDGDAKYWRVEDGAITGESTAENPCKRNTFLIWRLGELDDFELRLRYRITAGNSGIQYRSIDRGDWKISGYQADISADGRWTGTNYHEHGRAILAKRGQKVVVGDGRGNVEVLGSLGDAEELLAKIKPNDWNEYRIVAHGRRLIQEINGTVMSDVLDKGEKDFLRSGVLALQIHSGPPMKVQFKDIHLKRLALADGEKKVVLVAGRKSHGFGSHEHRAGCMLLAKQLNANAPKVVATVYSGGWPKDPTAFDNANSIVMYMDGGGRHPINKHLAEMGALMKKGIGLVCLHYAVEVPKGESGDRMLDWTGGYFETWWSVNPHWKAEFKSMPDHPVARGVKPFSIDDEWYYHMRFRPGMARVSPILTAIPPPSTLKRKDGAHSNNQHVRARRGMPEHVAWASEREDGGRGFGFTGGHFHWGWGHDDFRKLALNAIVWTAGLDVPQGGVQSPTPTVDELLANQDYGVPKKFNRASLEAKLKAWNSPR